MFLKRIEMQGFKSFPDLIEINFTNDITGIVGPNGCGKSNITDAIRWVLGEQSVKSMRGSTMSDVIFAGTKQRKKVNVASVTLIFDNSQGLLNSEYDEIEVTRKLHRDTGEGEYYINKQPCRLKDIQDLTLDSGIGRDSLSIISQGTISNFADAKPVDRRGLFEDAAGVAKYKKRKIEALGKLSRTQDNIERMLDIVGELEKQVSPLARQRKKALLYKEKQQELQTIEVAVLVHEIDKQAQEITNLEEIIFEMDSKQASIETNLLLNDTNVYSQKERINALDSDIHHSQEKLMSLMNDISRLEARKTELDEKSKYVLEVGNQQEKIAELQSLLRDAKAEYDDRVSRLEKLKTEVDLLNQQSLQNNYQLVELNNSYQQTISTINQLTVRRNNQQQLIDRPFISIAGVNAILNQRHHLTGIQDVVSKLLNAQDGYELAVTTALGGSLNHLVAIDENAAKEAIAFLKRNASGRATFIPLNTIKERHVGNDDLMISNNVKGFLGVASDFIDCDRLYIGLSKSLLGNVLVCEDIDSANTLAHYLNYRYKIVTLEGDIFYVGGNIAGGKQKENTSLLMAKKEIAELTQQLEKYENRLIQIENKKSEITHIASNLSSNLMEARLGIAQIEPIVEVKLGKVHKLSADLELLQPNEGEHHTEDFKNDLITALNDSYYERDNIVNALSIKREERLKLANEQQRITSQNSQLRKESSTLNAQISALKIQKAKAESAIDNARERLGSQYQLTYDYAKEHHEKVDLEGASERVSQLRNDIAKLGSINMNAPEEYEEVNSRYEFLNKQLSELETAKKNLLSFIDEMDGIMSVQFKEMFDKINTEFNGVFTSLFGGGKGQLVLEDPQDILNTGIDIDVQPPGKSIQNIRLFSGGEKSLIAISVLFAIIRARSVPLCIFDEVEAALDQGNVERFARYIGKFRDNTQFIIVTHRPGTMTQCDILFGVTMAQQGVSNILRVQLKDAYQLTEGKESA